MIQSCHIDKNSQWTFLPWQYINTRIILVQRKIFDASRQYNLQMLYKAQNYLINSNEIKLIAIDTILNRTQKYYKFYSHEKYSYKDIDKFYILKNLFNEKDNIKTHVKFIIEKVKEYIVYLCLEPEWKARLFNDIKKKSISNKKIQFKEKKNHCRYYLKIQKQFFKFKIFTDSFTNLTIIPYINQYIKYWLSNRFFFYGEECINKNLIYLLNNIYLSKLSWYYIKIIKCNFLFFSNKSKIFIRRKLSYMKLVEFFQFNSQKIKDLIQQFFEIIKLKFYRKDYINRLRLRKDFNWLLIIKIIVQQLQNYYCLYKKLLSNVYINLITFKINNLLLHLKINQNYSLVKNVKYYIDTQLYNLLYKKIIFQYIYLSLFKVTR